MTRARAAPKAAAASRPLRAGAWRGGVDVLATGPTLPLLLLLLLLLPLVAAGALTCRGSPQLSRRGPNSTNVVDVQVLPARLRVPAGSRVGCSRRERTRLSTLAAAPHPHTQGAQSPAATVEDTIAGRRPRATHQPHRCCAVASAVSLLQPRHTRPSR